ncbi:hypothetical protein [Lewinella sp. LCG006]|uniref:DUF7005 family protein n=1 Tax=Lewinella sp. LCG006 TaxID=3231911 RepID=UPI00345FFF14
MTIITANNDLLSAYTSNELVHEALRAYTQNAFRVPGGRVWAGKALADEPHIATWKKYLKEAEEEGVYACLRRHLVQFQFPIQAQISETIAYGQATRRGESTTSMKEATGLGLECAEGLELFLYESIAGCIPVIVTAHREDFKSIVQALCNRNEPCSLPDSMGAVLVRGLNNWDRVRQVKQVAALGQIAGDWRQQRELYQDSIIVLSRIPYSNVPAEALGLKEEDWLEKSLQIRLAHECAHYYTLRQFGSMSVNMHDELIADYLGICSVCPTFTADWFLRFIGLENYPVCRPDGRLHNYLGTPSLSAPALGVLQTILFRAAHHVAIFDEQIGTRQDPQRLARLNTLCRLNLLEMAAPNGVGRLLDDYHNSQH